MRTLSFDEPMTKIPGYPLFILCYPVVLQVDEGQ